VARDRLGSQDGVALPVATAMMLVISLFVAAFFATALQVNDTSVDDRASKRALAAAEAGLQMAMYRLNNRIGTNQPAQCLTNDWVSPSGSPCPDWLGETVGNEASYTYYVTPEMDQLPAAQRTCVVLPGQTLAGTDRCITAIGRASGVQRRLQVRVARVTGAASYKSIGLMSKSLMYAGNSAEIKSDIGVNGVAHFGNSATTYETVVVDGALLRAPGSTYETSGSGQVIAGGQQAVPTPFVFPPINFEAAEVAAEATNLKTLPPWIAPSGSVYNPVTKHFTVTGEATLPAGTYYFCRFYMENSAKLTFTSYPIQIYVDSPSREGSLCTGAGQGDPAGTFWLRNSNEFNKGGREELVEVFVHGTPYDGTRTRPTWCTPAGDTPPPPDVRCKSDVLLNNSSGFEGMINAPDTTVELNNSGVFTGAIAADKIRFNNSVKFELTAAVEGSAPPTTAGVRRGSWVECAPSPSTSGDPESGC
jgi:Tfp pilus assembly protein PilX